MHVAILDKQCNRPSRAMLKGIERVGDRASAVYPGHCLPPGEFPEANVVAVNGLQGSFRVAFDHYRSKGTPVLVMEQGHITQTTHFQLGWNRLCWLPVQQCPPDRAKRVILPGVDVVQQDRGGYVLVLGQKPNDAQHDLGIHIARWGKELLPLIREATGRRVVFRRHPKDGITPLAAYRSMGYDELQADPDSLSFGESLDRAHSVVCHNSNGGLVALLRGIPVFCHPSAFYAPLACSTLTMIETWKGAPEPERSAFLNRIAYAQWTEPEIESGEAWAYMKGHIEDA